MSPAAYLLGRRRFTVSFADCPRRNTRLSVDVCGVGGVYFCGLRLLPTDFRFASVNSVVAAMVPIRRVMDSTYGGCGSRGACVVVAAVCGFDFSGDALTPLLNARCGICASLSSAFCTN